MVAHPNSVSKNQKRTQLKTVFLTGVNGLLGTNLVHALLKRGYIIYAIIRDKNKYVGKRSKNLHLITMDLFGDYEKYLQKSDIVVHAAADTSTNKTKYSDYDAINFKATKRLFELSQKNGIEKFVFISTANTTGYGSKLKPGKEDHPIRKPFDQLFYAQSKAKAENYLLAQNSEIKVNIINPTFLIGPYDSKPSSGRIILMALNKPVVFYPPGGKNFVPAKDVVQAIIHCFEFGVSGEKYIIAGENLSYKEFFQKLKTMKQSKQLLIPLPRFSLPLLGYFGKVLSVFNIKTSLQPVNMKVLGVNNYYSNKKSKGELNMKYTSLDDALQEATNYLSRNKR